jgi:hypothetical protein
MIFDLSLPSLTSALHLGQELIKLDQPPAVGVRCGLRAAQFYDQELSGESSEPDRSFNLRHSIGPKVLCHL